MMSPMPKFGSGSVRDSEDKHSSDGPRSKVADALSEYSSRYEGSVLSMPNIEVVKPSSKNLVFDMIEEQKEEHDDQTPLQPRSLRKKF
jgi:hypothetical protein